VNRLVEELAALPADESSESSNLVTFTMTKETADIVETMFEVVGVGLVELGKENEADPPVEIGLDVEHNEQSDVYTLRMYKD
jgi:hypothetical protein